MYLFDTDTITNITKKIPSRKLISNINKLKKEERFLSTIAIGEITYGAFNSNNPNHYINELKNIYEESENDDIKAQVDLFEKNFRNITRPAVLSELRKLKLSNVSGRPLLDRLTEIWYRHSLHEVSSEGMLEDDIPPIPKIICGELM